MYISVQVYIVYIACMCDFFVRHIQLHATKSAFSATVQKLQNEVLTLAFGLITPSSLHYQFNQLSAYQMLIKRLHEKVCKSSCIAAFGQGLRVDGCAMLILVPVTKTCSGGAAFETASSSWHGLTVTGGMGEKTNR